MDSAESSLVRFRAYVRTLATDTIRPPLPTRAKISETPLLQTHPLLRNNCVTEAGAAAGAAASP
jgi:hypothetical protein